MLTDLKRAFLEIPPADLFNMCMKNNMEILSIYIIKGNRTRYKEFTEQILAKTREINKHKNINMDIEQYFGELYDYQVAWLRKRNGEKYLRNIFYENYIKPIPEIRLYSQAIKMLKISIESKCDVDVKITDIHDKSLKIKDKELSKLLLQALIKIYKKRKYNFTKNTTAEAIAFIKNPINRGDVKELCHVAHLDFNTIDIDNPPQALINKVANDFAHKRPDITLDFINTKMNEIKKLEDLNIKLPKPKKVEHLAPLALDLSYLIRLESFIFQDECDHIYNYRLGNKECELIFEYFAFWGLVNLEKITSNYVYISSLINTYKKKRGPYDPVNNYYPNEKAIDDLRFELRKKHYNNTPE